jgi:nucleotide-binding universal stress UspA family protein
MMVPLDLSVMESTCSEEMSNALKMLRGYADQFKAVSIPCEVHVYAGDPKKVITEQAEKMKANMIAMGFHTKTAIRALVLGSTSEYVTKHAHDAYVLIVK